MNQWQLGPQPGWKHLDKVEVSDPQPGAGENLGKYRDTARTLWRDTGDARLQMQLERLMYQLVHAQLPDGYLCTYPPEDYWTSWDV